MLKLDSELQNHIQFGENMALIRKGILLCIRNLDTINDDKIE